MFEGSITEEISIIISFLVGGVCGGICVYVFYLWRGKKSIDKLIKTTEGNIFYWQNKAEQIKRSRLNKEIACYKENYFAILRDDLYKSCQLVSSDDTPTLNDCEFKEILGSIEYGLDNFNPFKDVGNAHIVKKDKDLINMLIQILDKCSNNDELSAYKEEIIKKMNKYFNSLNLNNYEDEIKNYRNKFVDNNSLNTED